QSSDGIQQLHTVTKRGDAKLLQVLVRQARENRLVYVVLAEDRLILPEAKVPQPDHNDGDPNSGLPHIIVLPGGGVQNCTGSKTRGHRINKSANSSLRPACTEGGLLSSHPNRCNLRLVYRSYSNGVRLLLAATLTLRWGRCGLRRWAYRVELSLLLVAQRGVEVLKVRANRLDGVRHGS